MQLKGQCCTKEQALRLVELGVKPEATFWHMKAKDGPHGEYVAYGYTSEAVAPAYNVAELMDMLPVWVEGDNLTAVKDWNPYDDSFCYTVGYKSLEDRYFNIGCGDYSLATAAAGCLIIMLEKKGYELPAEWRQSGPVKESK